VWGKTQGGGIASTLDYVGPSLPSPSLLLSLVTFLVLSFLAFYPPSSPSLISLTPLLFLYVPFFPLPFLPFPFSFLFPFFPSPFLLFPPFSLPFTRQFTARTIQAWLAECAGSAQHDADEGSS
jgi:hypothetical protein